MNFSSLVAFKADTVNDLVLIVYLYCFLLAHLLLFFFFSCWRPVVSLYVGFLHMFVTRTWCLFSLMGAPRHQCVLPTQTLHISGFLLSSFRVTKRDFNIYFCPYWQLNHILNQILCLSKSTCVP